MARQLGGFDPAAVFSAMPGRPLFALLLVVLVAACGPQAAIDAVALLRDLRPGPAVEVRSPSRVAVTWTDGGEARRGDLYAAKQADWLAAIVLVPGLAPQGRDDPRLIDLAEALSKAGFAVLVPDLPNFAAQRATAADGARIAGALRHLVSRPEGRGKVGVGAVSYAVGPAVIALLEPDLAPRVDFLVAIGGYYDLTAVITFFTTGFYRDGPGVPWQHAQPNAYGKWVFVLANADRIARPFDRAALTAMARRKLLRLDADIADLRRGLGPEGEAVVLLLDNGDPERVPALIERLPAALRADLVALDLKRRDLAGLKAEAILIHGRDDAIVPYVESRALAGAWPRGQAHLALLDSLAHADLQPGGAIDALRLWRAAYLLLGQRAP